MKSNNIVIGVLVAVIAIMGVAFAAFSTTLKINGSASIASTWNVTLQGATCTNTTQKDSGKASTCTLSATTGSTITATIGFASPGDVITLNVYAYNLGSLTALANMNAKMYLTTNTSANCTNVTTKGQVTPYTTSGAGTASTATTITYAGQTIGPTTIISASTNATNNKALYTFTFTYNASATGVAGACTFEGTLTATQES